MCSGAKFPWSFCEVLCAVHFPRESPPETESPVVLPAGVTLPPFPRRYPIVSTVPCILSYI